MLRFLVWSALILAVIVGLARAVAIRWIRLPVNDPTFEASILPSLAGGDLVIAARITRPTFGDLVLCPEPDYPTRYVVGRIAGEGGDEVRIVNGVPYVNGQKFIVERGCDPGYFEYPHPDDESIVKQQCEWEALATHLHKVGSIGNHTVSPSESQTDVEEGRLFLLSDNRLHPYDSRDFGTVDAATCKETIVLRLVSRDGWLDADHRIDYIQ
jgi:signal peptidase I